MTTKVLARPLVVFICVIAIGVSALGALPATTPESIQQQLTQTLGAPAGSLEVSTSTSLLTIRRINTALNDSTHTHRNQEAEKIARTASESLKGLPNAAKILAINVEYIKRAKGGGHDHLVDRIELRKDPDGTFKLHIT